MPLLTAEAEVGGQGRCRGDEDMPPPSLFPSDCPQVQCVHPYMAQQPDELTLDLADILNILDKTEDGEARGLGASRTRGSLPAPPGALPQPEECSGEADRRAG